MSVAVGEHKRFLRLGLLLLYVPDSCPRVFGVYGLGKSGSTAMGSGMIPQLLFSFTPFEHSISHDWNCRRSRC